MTRASIRILLLLLVMLCLSGTGFSIHAQTVDPSVGQPSDSSANLSADRPGDQSSGKPAGQPGVQSAPPKRTGPIFAPLPPKKPGKYDRFYYYKGYQYGSQANFNPVSMTMNYSFSIMQITNRNNRLDQLDFAAGAKNVWWNLTRPGAVIGQYGWHNFLTSEIIPTSFNPNHAQYWPNYKLHLIGGGMLYVQTAEWYAAHGVRYPRTMSLLTNELMHFINEFNENSSYTGPNVDPLADLYIFGPMGYMLFSTPGVPEFFARRLNLADWSFQPMVNPSTGELLNNGQKFAFKYFMPFEPRLGFFYLTGTEGMVGGSWRYNREHTITLSTGMAVHDLEDVDQGTGVRTLTAKLIWTHGVFWDRNNSLLASVILGGPRGYIGRVNIYPGVLKIGRFSPGLAFLAQENHRYTLGIFYHLLPVGLAGSTRPGR